MQLPKLVHVGPHDYLVHVKERLPDDDFGEIDFETLVITISGRVDIQVQIETLLHELLHAINQLADITDDTAEEDVVTRTTPYLLALIRDNPELISGIQGCKNG